MQNKEQKNVSFEKPCETHTQTHTQPQSNTNAQDYAQGHTQEHAQQYFQQPQYGVINATGIHSPQPFMYHTNTPYAIHHTPQYLGDPRVDDALQSMLMAWYQCGYTTG
ncbi:hypothetical protein EON63_03480, partial [archaeon]